MKRIDMISKIASVIINHNEVGNITAREKALKMAEVILNLQEELGMAAPMLDDLSFKVLPSGEMTYEVRQWED